ncbi:hypothetical protein CBM2626_A40325 [Cupriavidus taiwanensis]|nr:hypothetical protein CBM2626_A40325 [Cupriavidus taiwanensis]
MLLVLIRGGKAPTPKGVRALAEPWPVASIYSPPASCRLDAMASLTGASFTVRLWGVRVGLCRLMEPDSYATPGTNFLARMREDLSYAAELPRVCLSRFLPSAVAGNIRLYV